MTKIKLKELSTETEALTIDKSRIIIGSGWLQTVQGITAIATGVAGIGTGIQQVYGGYQILSGNAPATPGIPGNTPGGNSNQATLIGLALQPSIHV